jgi:hypothetical protein
MEPKTRWPRRILSGLVTLALSLCAAAPALAQGGSTCVASPNVSATDQYCESLPTAQGGVPAATPSAGGVETLRDALTPQQVQKLLAAGPLGKALLDLPANTPLTAAEERLLDSAGLATGALPSPTSPAASSNPLTAVARSLQGGTTLPLLLVGLAVATVGAVGFAVVVVRPGGSRPRCRPRPTARPAPAPGIVARPPA